MHGRNSAPSSPDRTMGQRKRRKTASAAHVGHFFHSMRRIMPSESTSRPRKPCNCTKSLCLKLADIMLITPISQNAVSEGPSMMSRSGDRRPDRSCDRDVIEGPSLTAFSGTEGDASSASPHGIFNVFQLLSADFQACLDRNPEAFKPKIGKGKEGESDRRHSKGCNCKRSGCLKNYCECYEAKIMCSSICKCIGCKNFEESPERKTLMHLADAAEVRVQQQTAAKTKLSSQISDLLTRPAPSLSSGGGNPAVRPNSGLPPHMRYQRTQDKLDNNFRGNPSPRKSRVRAVAEDQKRTSWNEYGRRRSGPETPIRRDQQRDHPPGQHESGPGSMCLQPGYRSTFVTKEVAEATCACLLAQAEEGEKLSKSKAATERMILEEFGRCLMRVINSAGKAKSDPCPMSC
ncbi:unnamed protein product [Ranitomeya imitator]|uniref:Protein lin-54 homolog n=1 Tax=Ranitomeya imitator TaxID=111125 RepID=A0ABN9L3B6_9NEOB|nr:unnamed protein product [Ranitomeya imitator]